MEWAEVPQAGRWLEEAGGNADDGLMTYGMCLRIGHVVVVGSPYHTGGPTMLKGVHMVTFIVNLEHYMVRDFCYFIIDHLHCLFFS